MFLCVCSYMDYENGSLRSRFVVFLVWFHPYIYMQYTVSELVHASLVALVFARITANASEDVHFCHICVAALRASPRKFLAGILHEFYHAVIAALMAVISFDIKFCVHNGVVHVLYIGHDSRDVVLHVRQLDVRDGSSGGKLLELGFFFQFGEPVCFFGYMLVIRISNIVLISYTWDNSKLFL